ncbi:hypothetical protein C4900_04430 [Acidiferrobacter thiooxydans]|uniref:Uncharacterized protein n=1 Tax=Acidiferrobacter thiooxydans TaxID=163359 RepID=A0A1C2G0P8_9GAMM|nr:hypothetical protein C4900_04430 [Acidiferrobacter thiooxydans]
MLDPEHHLLHSLYDSDTGRGVENVLSYLELALLLHENLTTRIVLIAHGRYAMRRPPRAWISYLVIAAFLSAGPMKNTHPTTVLTISPSMATDPRRPFTGKGLHYALNRSHTTTRPMRIIADRPHLKTMRP